MPSYKVVWRIKNKLCVCVCVCVRACVCVSVSECLEMCETHHNSPKLLKVSSLESWVA